MIRSRGTALPTVVSGTAGVDRAGAAGIKIGSSTDGRRGRNFRRVQVVASKAGLEPGSHSRSYGLARRPVPFDVDVDGASCRTAALRSARDGGRGGAAKRRKSRHDEVAAMAAHAREGSKAGGGGGHDRLARSITAPSRVNSRHTHRGGRRVGRHRGAIGETGRGVLQASPTSRVDAEFAIFRSMAEESGRPVSFCSASERRCVRRQLEWLTVCQTQVVPMTVSRARQTRSGSCRPGVPHG